MSATSGTAFRPSAVLVTGGAGFVGSNLIRFLLAEDPQLEVVNLDALTYAGNVESLEDVAAANGIDGDGRYYFIRGDIRDTALVTSVLRGSARESVSGRGTPLIDGVLHLAAESHVDRSILGPAAFVSTNVEGAHILLAATKAELDERERPFRFVNVSTDEVYGSLGPRDPAFTESSPLRPNSPYAASKAGADCLVRAYRETFGLPCLTTRCSNNYGPYQFPEKLIPLMITRALSEQSLPIYGDGENIRDWLHVSDHVRAVWWVMTRGRLEDEVYNIGGESEMQNVDIVRLLLRILDKPESMIAFVRDRPGHDRRYAMDISRIRTSLGWTPRFTFEDGLRETIGWYVANERWWRRVQSEAYRSAEALYLRPDSTTRAI